MFSYSGQILPARFAQEFSLYPALNSPFRRLSKKKITKNKNFKLRYVEKFLTNFEFKPSFTIIESDANTVWAIPYGNTDPSRYFFNFFLFKNIEKDVFMCKIFKKYRKRSQMKAHDSLILKLALNSKSGKNFSSYRTLKI